MYSNEFDRLGINSKLAIDCLSTIFPVFANDVNENKSALYLTTNIRRDMRIAQEDRFELYFMFDIDDIKVSRNSINGCIYEFDEDRLKCTIEEINKKGEIEYFLEEMRSLIERIPYNRLEILALVIIDLQGTFCREEDRWIFTVNPCDSAEYFIYDIIKMLNTEEEKCAIIRRALENVGSKGLLAAAQIINRIELAYGRLAGDFEKKEDQIIGLEALKNIEKIYLEKIKNIANDESFLYIDGFKLMFYLWRCFDKDSATEYIRTLFVKSENKLKYICAIANRWSGTNGGGWSFNKEYYFDYISRDEIFKLIRDNDKSKLNRFSELEQVKLASFFLNYYKHELNHVSEKEAKRLVKQWKSDSDITKSR